MTQSTKKNIVPFFVIIGGSILLLISFGMRHSMGLYLIPISEHLNTGRELFSFASALSVLMIGVGSPIFGALSDKYGSGRAAILGIILVILSLLWMANLQGSFDIIASQTIFGLGAAGCGTAVVLGAVGRSVQQTNRTLALGVVMAAGSFGQFIMVPAISYLIQIFGWSQSLIILAFIGLIMIAFSFFMNYFT